MKNNEYPTWLVPLDIAQELKGIGFDEPCNHYVRISNDDIKLKINHSSIGWVILKRNSEYLNDDIASFVTIPIWEQALAWFRARGYKITFKDINIGTQCAFYHLDINEGHTFSHFAKKYEKAREGLVLKLIEVHKEFGNNIKRFD